MFSRRATGDERASARRGARWRVAIAASVAPAGAVAFVAAAPVAAGPASAATAIDLGTLGGTSGRAVAVSGNIVVGYSTNADGQEHAFAYDLGAASPVMRDLGTLGGSSSGALAVSGTVAAGFSAMAGNAAVHATAWLLGPTTATTTTAVTPSRNPGTVGRPVTFTATVSPAPGGGTASFTDNGAPIDGCQAVPLSGGSATCTVTYKGTGAHRIAATYSGTSGFAASTSPALTEVISAKPCASFAGCNLAGVNLTGANLTDARLTGAHLFAAKLAHATLAHASLAGAALSLANLRGADLTGADLTHANLILANLTGASLRGVNLARASLSGANLSGADLDGATLTGADLHWVTWSATTCPDGTNSDSNGGTCRGHL